MHPSAPSGAGLGAYQVIRTVSEGPGATVYEARDGSGNRVAIKLAAGSGSDRRFAHEIDVLSRLRHPNVVALLDHGVDDGGRPYLVTPFVHGATLRQLVTGPISPEAALLLLGGAAAGVAALHQVGFVHRDLKPENIMLTPSGELVIIDLGLAFTAEHTRYTEEGAVVGSVPYMAPEQIEGVDPAPTSDVWSLAVMAYEWIAGRRPFQRGRQSEEVAAILAGRHQPLAEVDRRVSLALSQLIARCLSAPPNRPADAGALIRELAPLYDWLDGATWQPELALLAADPLGYVARAIPARVAQARAEAEAALAAGDAFAATRALDRGLAYAPNEPGLAAMVERTLTAPPSAAKRRVRWPFFISGAVLVVSVAAAAVVALSGGSGDARSAGEPATVEPPPPEGPAAPPAALIDSPDAAPAAVPAAAADAPDAAPPPPNQAYDDDEVDPMAPWESADSVILTP